jgi:dTDP-glucose 4,6-dehydratase
MRIVVTGGCGFIGSHFVNLLATKGSDIEVLVVDKMTYAADINNIISANYKILQKDICDLTLEDLGHYDYLVNFAAESHVDNSIKDGRPFVRTNVEGTFNLLELARQNPNLQKFIQISTDEVYGDMADYIIIDEADTELPLQSSSYYSATKASSDLLVQAAGRTYGLRYLITRTCNNYGENQHKEKLIPTIINCIKNNKPIPIYGDGLNVREWIYANDNCENIFNLMIGGYEGIYHIGSGERYSNLEVIGLIEDILNKRIDFEFIEDRKGHDRIYALNSDETPNLILNNTLENYLRKELLF